MQIVAIDKRDPRPVYAQIGDEIRRAIAVGALHDDDVLPSVRQMAHDLGVNPNTVKQAYRDLERAGVVRARRGEGTFVAAGRKPGTERAAVAQEVATRAVRDARRHGLSVDDLVAAVRELKA
jgi:GntR family transcriptional regulator